MRFTHPPSDEDLLHLYAAPSSPWTRANMVSTLDGRAAGSDGRSGSINSYADMQVFSVLRALCAAVVVGAGTVRAEGYRRLRSPERFREQRRFGGLSEHPVLVVVTSSGQVPERVLETHPDRGRLIVLTTDRMPPAHLERIRAGLGTGDEVVVAGEDRVDPARAVRALRERGLADLLCEGGPTLLDTWIRAGVVDELCLTVRPLLDGGSGPRILEPATDAPPGSAPGPAADSGPLASAETVLVLEIEDDVMLRHRLHRPARP